MTAKQSHLPFLSSLLALRKEVLHIHAQAAQAEKNLMTSKRLGEAAAFISLKEQALALAKTIDALGEVANGMLGLQGVVAQLMADLGGVKAALDGRTTVVTGQADG